MESMTGRMDYYGVLRALEILSIELYNKKSEVKQVPLEVSHVMKLADKIL